MGNVINLKTHTADELTVVRDGLKDGSIKSAVVVFQKTGGTFCTGIFDGGNGADVSTYLEKVGMVQTALQDLYAKANDLV